MPAKFKKVTNSAIFIGTIIGSVVFFPITISYFSYRYVKHQHRQKKQAQLKQVFAMNSEDKATTTHGLLKRMVEDDVQYNTYKLTYYQPVLAQVERLECPGPDRNRLTQVEKTKIKKQLHADLTKLSYEVKAHSKNTNSPTSLGNPSGLKEIRHILQRL